MAMNYNDTHNNENDSAIYIDSAVSSAYEDDEDVPDQDVQQRINVLPFGTTTGFSQVITAFADRLKPANRT